MVIISEVICVNIIIINICTATTAAAATTTTTNNNSIQFNSLLFMCWVNSCKANYRHSTVYI
jgi:hypothetical protein